MRRLFQLLLVGTIGACLAAPTAAVSTRPALQLTADSPLTFSGVGFRANEHVRVVVVAGSRAVRRATAGARGRFVVRFRGLSADSCRGLTATAIGDRGSRAGFKRPPGDCPAP